MKHHWILIILIAGIILLLGGSYALGYRVGPGMSLVKTHTLTVNHLLPGAQVFADFTPRETAAADAVSFELTPGTHTILVSADGYQPWEGLVSVPENADTRVSAFLIPKTVTPHELVGNEAVAANKIIAATTLPTASTTLALLDGCASVFVSGNRILAKANLSSACVPPPYLCADTQCDPTVIFAPIETLRSVSAYPGRTDALIVAAGIQIYALGLDARTPQAFGALVKGVAPQVAVQADGTVLISDDGHTYSLSLLSSK